MYISEFAAGVFSTLFVEFILLGIAIVILINRYGKR